MVSGNILITLVCFENILITISLFWEHHDHIQKTEQHLEQISNVLIEHVVETFSESLGKFQMTANCYGGLNVVYMLMLHSKCCIDVLIGSRSNTQSGYIWNVPNLLLVGKWQVPSTRACNVLKMLSLVSRPPHPQYKEQVKVASVCDEW